jgi:hypothetical protein
VVPDQPSAPRIASGASVMIPAAPTARSRRARADHIEVEPPRARDESLVDHDALDV